jgi:hypothetical protein
MACRTSARRRAFCSFAVVVGAAGWVLEACERRDVERALEGPVPTTCLVFALDAPSGLAGGLGEAGVGGDVGCAGKGGAVTDGAEQLDRGARTDAGHRGEDLGQRVSRQKLSSGLAVIAQLQREAKPVQQPLDAAATAGSAPPRRCSSPTRSGRRSSASPAAPPRAPAPDPRSTRVA